MRRLFEQVKLVVETLLTPQVQTLSELTDRHSRLPRRRRKAILTSHLNSSTILYHNERLALKIQEYMGTDILIQIRRKPNWKDSLDASRERLACREERRHL